MDKKTVIFTTRAPAPIAPFSQGLVHNGIVYCSGSIGLDPKTNKFVDGGVRERTIQIIKNLSSVLEDAGSSLNKVLKVNVFLTSMETFEEMNEGYKQYFNNTLPVINPELRLVIEADYYPRSEPVFV